MISLEKASGLPIKMRDNYSLVFEKDLVAPKPQIRQFSSMKNYLKDPGSSYLRKDVYHIYRNIGRTADLKMINKAGLEYDLTVIPPGKIGDEFVKTIGHYHPMKKDTHVRYSEVYEVVYGKVFWLLQSASDDLERLEEVYLVAGGQGQKLVVPLGFGHVSINPTDQALVLANWQVLGNQGIYEPYETHNGAAYYVIQSERLSRDGKTVTEFEFVPNLHYKHVPELLRVQARELPQYDLRTALPMYFTGTKNLSAFDFLNNPENYLDELVPKKLFTSPNI